MADAGGIVRECAVGRITVDDRVYDLARRPVEPSADSGRALIWPQWSFWHEPVVEPGQPVAKRQLLARGVTHIFFQANRRIFTGLALLLAIFMGIGMAAVYKHIPTYFPNDVGVVGGLVGVLGGLGGFVFPILFGYLLKATGIWTTCWLFLLLLAAGCLAWMHAVIQRMLAERAPRVAHHIDEPAIARELDHVAHEIEGLAARLRRGPAGAA